MFTITPVLFADENGLADIVDVTIPSNITADLYGKYVYQITIVDVSGRVEIPNQGIMNITKNINKMFISTIEGGK